MNRFRLVAFMSRHYGSHFLRRKVGASLCLHLASNQSDCYSQCMDDEPIFDPADYESETKKYNDYVKENKRKLRQLERELTGENMTTPPWRTYE